MREWLFEASATCGGILVAYFVAVVAESISRRREERRVTPLAKPRSIW